jgi:adenine deaminase
VDGHCPLLSGTDLNAYIAAGIRTEHEATSADEAREKLQKGMRVLIREGSVSKDLAVLQPLLTERTAPYMCLCTDDRNPLDIAEHGHLDYMIRTLIASGTPPLAAYRAASLSAAEAFGLRDRGLIAPGKRADIVAVDSLEGCHARLVLAAGRVVDAAAFAARPALAPVGRASVKAPRVAAEDFRDSSNRPETHVIGIREGQILTDHLHETITPEGGDKRPDPARDLARIAVVERHGKNGNIATGFVRGFGLQAGAIASTVCHDHHNIACVGIDYADMALAANRLTEIEGGFVVAKGGAVLAELALPVAGLMSLAPFEEVRDRLVELRAAARSLGVQLEEPFLQLAFLALPVIPALKITDRGLVDVTRFEILA